MKVITSSFLVILHNYRLIFIVTNCNTEIFYEIQPNFMQNRNCGCELPNRIFNWNTQTDRHCFNICQQPIYMYIRMRTPTHLVNASYWSALLVCR